VPFVSLAGAVVIVEPVKKWVFKTPHTDRMACEKIFVDMRARGAAKAALISGAGGFDRSMRAECLKVRTSTRADHRRRDLRRGRHRHDRAARQDQGQTPGVQAVLNAGFGQGPAIVTKNYRQLRHRRAAVPVPRRASKQYREPLRRRGGKAYGCPPRACWCADTLPGDDQQKKVVTSYKPATRPLQAGSVDRSAASLRRPDAHGRGDPPRPAPPTRRRCAMRLESIRGYVGTGGVVNMSAQDHMGLDLRPSACWRCAKGDWPRWSCRCCRQFLLSGLTTGDLRARRARLRDHLQREPRHQFRAGRVRDDRRHGDRRVSRRGLPLPSPSPARCGRDVVGLLLEKLAVEPAREPRW
jgi:branched-chain amino acid transport system substrate-binding protein